MPLPQMRPLPIGQRRVVVSGAPEGVRGVHLPFGGNLDSGETLLRSRAEAASLIGTTASDLDILPIGDRRIYLSRNKQHERTEPNHAATVVVQKLIPALNIAIYGDVVVTREDIPDTGSKEN